MDGAGSSGAGDARRRPSSTPGGRTGRPRPGGKPPPSGRPRPSAGGSDSRGRYPAGPLGGESRGGDTRGRGSRGGETRGRGGAEPPAPEAWRNDPRREQRRLPVPPDTDIGLLDPAVWRELRALSKEVAERVAGHLVAAGQALDDDPARALAHARAARSLAGRVGAVREAAGISAYRAGEFAEAVAELRTARRITGSAEHLPLLADCERALGRPERALALVRDPAARTLDQAARIELLIVTAGARRDLGQTDAAVVALQGRDLESDTVQEWTPRLWYAYADALLAAGRADEARTWFLAVASIDDAGATDAGERLAALPAG